MMRKNSKSLPKNIEIGPAMLYVNVIIKPPG